MRRNASSSLLSFLCAVIVTMSAAGISVMHGFAHLHAAEHEITHAESGQRLTEPERLLSATIEGAEHAAHEHVESEAAVTSRGSAAQFVVVAVVAFSLGTDIPVTVVAPHAEPLDVPGGPPPDRATQPRAPPLG